MVASRKTRQYFLHKNVLITGGSSGIGRSIAGQCVALGANVLIVGRRESLLLEAVAEMRRLSQQPSQKILHLALDLRTFSASAAIVQTLEAFAPDILINNAGVCEAKTFLDFSAEEFAETLATNFFGAVTMTRLMLPSMVRRGRGHIAFVSSVAGLVGIYAYTAYSGSKFALDGFAQALRCELRPKNIAVSVVYPPDTDTPGLHYERSHSPPETKALGGNILVSADSVAGALIQGMAKGQFAVIPGLSNRLLVAAMRHLPRLTRTVMDLIIKRSQRRTGTGPPDAPSSGAAFS